MAIFEKRAGAPAGLMTLTLGGASYTVNDGGSFTVTDPNTINSLSNHPYVQLQGGTGGPYTAPPVIADVFLKDGVLTSGATGLPVSVGAAGASVDAFGADPTGTNDSTAAFQAALNSLPTVTIYAHPLNSTGASATYHYGTLRLGVGNYKLGTTTDVGNIGPFVNVVGSGRNATTLNYYGAGDCIRMFNGVKPLSDTFDDLAAFYGVINGFTIDGSHCQPGARGLHYGDTEGGVLGPDLMIQNFVGGQIQTTTLSLGTTSGSGGTFGAGTYYWKVTATNAAGETWGSNEVTTTLAANGTQVLNWSAVTGATGYNIYRGTSSLNEKLVASVGAVTTYTDTGTAAGSQNFPAANVIGCIGLYLDNAVSWTENNYGRVIVRNCDNCIVFDRTAGDSSFEYNDWTFKVYCMPNQNGMVVRNGAVVGNNRIKLKANMATSNSSMNNALLTITGQFSGTFSGLAYCHLDIQAETNLGLANKPRTIFFGGQFTGQNYLQGCTGIIRFLNAWTSSNWSAAGTKSNAFTFAGPINGDTALHPGAAQGSASQPVWQAVGAIGYGNNPAFYSGSVLTFQMQIGDVMTGTLTQNSTIAFTQTMTGPQRKLIILNQDATGGRTVAWPAAVKWAGGTAPVMTTTANATDIYEIITNDGTTWYGRVIAQAAA